MLRENSIRGVFWASVFAKAETRVPHPSPGDQQSAERDTLCPAGISFRRWGHDQVRPGPRGSAEGIAKELELRGHCHVDHPSATELHEPLDLPQRVAAEGLGGQVHGPQLVGINGQDGAPGGGAGAALSLPGGQVSSDRAGSMLHAQFRPELQLDPVLAPLRMIGRDAADEVDVVPRDGGSAATWPTGSSSPVAAVPFPVPPEDRCRLNQHQGGAPPTPVPAEPYSEQPVSGPEERPGSLPLKHRELVTEDSVLRRQGGVRPSQPSEGAEDQKEPGDHGSTVHGRRSRSQQAQRG